MNNRELDWLVAEHIFGSQVPVEKREMTFLNSDGELKWLGPHYSTDIAAAFKVVEKLSADGEFELDHTSSGFWGCKFSSGERCFEPTAPMAIAQAALSAVGVEP